MIIHVEYGDRNSIVELTEMERSQLKDYVKNEDQIHGFDVSDDRKYNSDDYLFRSSCDLRGKGNTGRVAFHHLCLDAGIPNHGVIKFLILSIIMIRCNDQGL